MTKAPATHESFILKTLTGPVSVEVDILIRELLYKAMTERGLPAAQKASGSESIAAQISVIPVERHGDDYTVGLSTPGVYAYVDLGTGSLAGGSSWTLTKKQRKGKGFLMPWGYRASAGPNEGQVARNFLEAGTDACTEAFEEWFPSSLSNLLF